MNILIGRFAAGLLAMAMVGGGDNDGGPSDRDGNV